MWALIVGLCLLAVGALLRRAARSEEPGVGQHHRCPGLPLAVLGLGWLGAVWCVTGTLSVGGSVVGGASLRVTGVFCCSALVALWVVRLSFGLSGWGRCCACLVHVDRGGFPGNGSRGGDGVRDSWWAGHFGARVCGVDAAFGVCGRLGALSPVMRSRASLCLLRHGCSCVPCCIASLGILCAGARWGQPHRHGLWCAEVSLAVEVGRWRPV